MNIVQIIAAIERLDEIAAEHKRLTESLSAALANVKPGHYCVTVGVGKVLVVEDGGHARVVRPRSELERTP